MEGLLFGVLMSNHRHDYETEQIEAAELQAHREKTCDWTCIYCDDEQAFAVDHDGDRCLVSPCPWGCNDR